jgi:hypothetical protein
MTHDSGSMDLAGGGETETAQWTAFCLPAIHSGNTGSRHRGVLACMHVPAAAHNNRPPCTPTFASRAWPSLFETLAKPLSPSHVHPIGVYTILHWRSRRSPAHPNRLPARQLGPTLLCRLCLGSNCASLSDCAVADAPVKQRVGQSSVACSGHAVRTLAAGSQFSLNLCDSCRYYLALPSQDPVLRRSAFRQQMPILSTASYWAQAFC